MNNLKFERNLIKTKFAIEQEINQRIMFMESEELNSLMNHEEEPEMTYEELLALGEQIGSVSKGLSLEEIGKLKSERVTCSHVCSICLVPIESGSIASKLEPCGHIYDLECIQTWLEQNKTCPLCLQEVFVY